MSKRRRQVKHDQSDNDIMEMSEINENSFECSPERLYIDDGEKIVSLPKLEPKSPSPSIVESINTTNENVVRSRSSSADSPPPRNCIKDARPRSPLEPGSFHQRLDSYDRRLARMEVTINKMFVLVNNLNQHILGKIPKPTPIIPVRMREPVSCPKGFDSPNFPIKSADEMSKLHCDLKHKNFFAFLVAQEEKFCTPGAATETATINSYLKRFIEISLRASMNLKEGKNATLHSSYPRIYDFLIAIMQKGFKAHQRELTSKAAQKALCTVWSRSKQTLDRVKNSKKWKKSFEQNVG